MKNLAMHSFGILLFLLVNNDPLLGQSWCKPVFKYNSMRIENFAFHTLVNIFSGNNDTGYSYYPDSVFTTSVCIGQTYPITISSDNLAGAHGRFAAWIDFNNDSIFDISEQIFFDSTTAGTTYGYVSIPEDLEIIGKKLLRVVYAYNGKIITSCGSYYDGEAEDYTINIIPNLNDSLTYCVPFNRDKNTDHYIIKDFNLNTIINNNSGSNFSNYVIYTQDVFSTDLFINTFYSVYINSGEMAGPAGGFSLWIDLDNDKKFSASERIYSTKNNWGGEYSTLGVFMIPEDPRYLGIRRLRIRSDASGTPTCPCGLYSDGETEDYFVNILNSPTSISEPSPNLNNYNLFPNPTQSSITIFWNTEMIGFYKVYLLDINGQVILEKVFSGEQSILDLNIFPEGIYFVKIVNDNGVWIEKIWKK